MPSRLRDERGRAWRPPGAPGGRRGRTASPLAPALLQPPSHCRSPRTASEKLSSSPLVIGNPCQRVAVREGGASRRKAGKRIERGWEDESYVLSKPSNRGDGGQPGARDIDGSCDRPTPYLPPRQCGSTLRATIRVLSRVVPSEICTPSGGAERAGPSRVGWGGVRRRDRREAAGLRQASGTGLCGRTGEAVRSSCTTGPVTASAACLGRLGDRRRPGVATTITVRNGAVPGSTRVAPLRTSGGDWGGAPNCG